MSSLKEEFEEKKNDLVEDIEETKDKIEETVKKGVTKTKRFFKRLFLFSFLGLVVAGGVYLFWCSMTYSTGTRTGYLIKISEKGYLMKTCEGQLNLGGFQESDQTSIVGNVWNFSLKEKSLYGRLEDLEGKKVTLRYKEINKSMPWQGDTNYFITEVMEK